MSKKAAEVTASLPPCPAGSPTCLEAASNTTGRPGFVFDTVGQLPYTQDYRTLISSQVRMGHKQRRRASLICSAAAVHCERQFYMCTSYSHNTVCTLRTPCLRRKPFKRNLWLLKINWSIYSQNLQPPPSTCCYIKIKSCFDFLHDYRLPLPSYFHSSLPYKVTRGFSHPVDIMSSLLHQDQSIPLSTSCRLSAA